MSRKKLLYDGMIFLSPNMEIMFIIMQIHIRWNLVRQLIRRLNGILYSAGENLKNIVMRTLRPTEIPLAFYAIAGVMSTILWCFLPLLTLDKKSVYWKEEYKMPSFISNEPHSQKTFMCNLFLTVGGIYIFLKNVDVYMIHLMLLMTAQYRYIGVKIAIIFREETGRNEDLQERGSSEVNLMQEREMIELRRYHNTMIE